MGGVGQPGAQGAQALVGPVVDHRQIAHEAVVGEQVVVGGNRSQPGRRQDVFGVERGFVQRGQAGGPQIHPICTLKII